MKRGDYYYYENWTKFRLEVFQRDKYICEKCGQLAKLKKINEEKDEGSRLFKKRILKEYSQAVFNSKLRTTKHGLKEKYLIAIVPNVHKLIADHIIPLALGGEEWNKKNVQTLCLKCNQIKTIQDEKDIIHRNRLKLFK